MLSFDYTLDLQTEDTLRNIDLLRSKILTLPLSPAAEMKLQWESMAIRTWASLSLSGLDAPKHQVATILAHSTKPTHATEKIYAQRNAYDYIHTTWRANAKPVRLNTLETIFTILHENQRDAFKPLENPLKELLSYLDTENTHPVIQASIAHMHMLSLSGENIGLFARMIHYLLLAKYGYDVRGYAAPDYAWLADKQTYARLTGGYRTNRHMTTWLGFMAEQMRSTLESLAGDIEGSRFHIEFPQSFWELTERQKEIIAFLSDPSASITNKKTQHHFKISQITASRDLSRLTSLGLLYPHGKGRSVYYTKI